MTIGGDTYNRTISAGQKVATITGPVLHNAMRTVPNPKNYLNIHGSSAVKAVPVASRTNSNDIYKATMQAYTLTYNENSQEQPITTVVKQHRNARIRPASPGVKGKSKI